MWTANGLRLVLLCFAFISCCYAAPAQEGGKVALLSEFIVDVKPSAQTLLHNGGEEEKEDEEGESGEDQPGVTRTLLECTAAACRKIVTKTNNEINKLVDTVLPTFTAKAQEQDVRPSKIDFISSQLRTLKNNQQDHNKKIDRNLGDFYVAIEKAKSRQTPNSQQHADRALQATQALGQGIMNLQRNMGVPGKEWEMLRDMATTASTIMSIIPNPYSKSASVFLNVLAQMIGIASYDTKPAVDKYVTEMKKIINREFNEERRAQAIGALECMNSYWAFLNHFDGRATWRDWEIYMASDEFPNSHIGARDLGTLQEHIRTGLADGEEATYQLIVLYARMASLRDDILHTMIQLRPKEDNPDANTTAYETLYNAQIELRRDAREKVFNFIDGILNDVNIHSIMALNKYFPPGRNGESDEIHRFYKKMTYQERSRNHKGVVVSMPPTKAIVDGDYFLESAKDSDWEGWFLGFQTTDSQEFILQSKVAGRYLDFDTYQSHLGQKIGTDDHKDRARLKISTTNDPFAGTKTIELLHNNKMVTFFNSAENTQRSKNGVPIFCRGKNEALRWNTKFGQFVDTRNKFRIIPLVRSDADRSSNRFPVIIGDAQDDYFMSQSDSRQSAGAFSRNYYDIYMEPLARTGKRVEPKFIFNLYSA